MAAIEIVDLPINSMVIFHSYVTNFQRVMATTIVGSTNLLWDQQTSLRDGQKL